MATHNAPKDLWSAGDLYEPYVGRWSRLVAKEFFAWLKAPRDGRWLDVGCGTGSLSQTILDLCDPKLVKGLDRSEGFVGYARAKVQDQRASFEVGDAEVLGVESDSYDFAVSGLVLNFVPQPEKMISEMKRAIKDNGTVAVYVWDYAEKMQMIRYFFDAAALLDPAARALDEGLRFPICSPAGLQDQFQMAGFKHIETRPIDIETRFKNFDDFWNPFLGGQGPAPSYAMSLNEERRAALREKIRESLPFAADGSIPLIARAWAIKGVK